jgi:hypothetical protein
MPLDEATHKLSSDLRGYLRELTSRERQRADRGEAITYDPISRMATWESSHGEVIGRWYAEVIATYDLRDRMLRWAWAGRTSLETASHADVVAEQGQARGVQQLAMSVVGDLDEAEAVVLARLGVAVARGDGLEIRRTATDLQFIGLFDSARPRAPGAATSGRYSVPPPPVRPSSQPSAASRHSAPPGSQRASARPQAPPYRSFPPIREIFEPRSARVTPSSVPVSSGATDLPEKTIREPARALFLPVATGMLQALNAAVPGFQQGLFVITVHSTARGNLQELAQAAGVTGAAPGGDAAKRRLVVFLVALDSVGVLRALDPSTELVDAAARLVEADRIDGNGPWRKLSARVTPKPDGGATLNVEVI